VPRLSPPLPLPSSFPSPPRAWLRFAVSTLLGVALLVALALWGGVDFTELLATLRRLSPLTFLAALAIHFAIYVARAERFRLLLPPASRPPRLGLLAVTSAHNLAVYVLPAKAGEATLPLYLGKAHGVGAAESLASLIVSRLFDLAALSGSMALVTAILCAGEHWTAPISVGIALAAVLTLAAIGFTALASRGDALIGPFQALSRRLGLANTNLGRKLDAQAESLKSSLRLAGHGSLRAGALALSVLVWLLIFVFYGVLALGFGLPDGVGFLHATFGSSVAVLMNLLPVNSFAGFGTQEAGWVLGFRAVGVAPELSLPGAVGVHLVQLVDTALFGLAGHVAMGLARRK